MQAVKLVAKLIKSISCTTNPRFIQSMLPTLETFEIPNIKPNPPQLTTIFKWTNPICTESSKLLSPTSLPHSIILCTLSTPTNCGLKVTGYVTKNSNSYANSYVQMYAHREAQSECSKLNAHAVAVHVDEDMRTNWGANYAALGTTTTTRTREGFSQESGTRGRCALHT